MTTEDIAKTLQQLKKEAATIASDDIKASENINQLIQHLEVQLSDPDQANDSSIMNQLKQSVEEFETTHPKFTATLNDLMIRLANMGI